MKLPHSVSEVLRDHIVLESEGIDRMYLNVYVPQLQRVGGVVWYLRGHLGQRFASTATMAPKTEEFVANVDRFVAEHGVDMVSFTKHQRKDESCPTRYEPGARGEIPVRNEPGWGLGEATGWLKGSLPARRVDHRRDGDRHERSAGAHLGAGASGAGRNAVPGIPAG